MTATGLHISGDTVDAIEVDERLTLRFSSGATLAFASEFALTHPDGAHAFLRPAEPTSLLGVLALHTKVVDRGSVDGSRITVHFASGELLEGWGLRDRASWQYAEPGRARVDIAALAGGDVSIRTSPGGLPA